MSEEKKNPCLSPFTHQTIIKEWVEYIAGPRPLVT